MSEIRRQHDPEFKAGAVRIVKEARRPVAEIARELGIGAGTLGNWVRKERGEAQSLSTDERSELIRLRRRAEIDAAVAASFETSGGTYGSPRVLADLRAEGWRVSKKTVEASMARQGLQGRRPKRRRGLTRPDQSARPAPDLLRRDFSAVGADRKWAGDFKQIDTAQGPVFLATVEDLFSRRLLGFALSDRHPTAELAQAAVNMAVAVRGGDAAGVIFHTDKGAQYTSAAFAAACLKLGIRQSMGRAGCALDNAAAESFFSTLHHERLSRRRYATRAQARRDVAAWIDQWYNRHRRHSGAGMLSPVEYEQANAA